MKQLVNLEDKGMTTNKALKMLKKDLKTVKRFQPIYQLYKRNEAKYYEVRNRGYKLCHCLRVTEIECFDHTDYAGATRSCYESCPYDANYNN